MITDKGVFRGSLIRIAPNTTSFWERLFPIDFFAIEDFGPSLAYWGEDPDAFAISDLLPLNSTDPNKRAPVLSRNGWYYLLVEAYDEGTWEFTITATTPDGESASLLVTVIVTEPLESKQITLGDALYLEEGHTTINLRDHYTGPESIDFAATSSNEEVATMEVTADGRLIVNAVSSGEIDVTVTATAPGGQHGQTHSQTFTIVVSADTPPWLERGFFSGWRKLLLLED